MVTFFCIKDEIKKVFNCSLCKMNYLISFATLLSHSVLLHSAWPVSPPFDRGDHEGGGGGGQDRGVGVRRCVLEVF